MTRLMVAVVTCLAANAENVPSAEEIGARAGAADAAGMAALREYSVQRRYILKNERFHRDAAMDVRVVYRAGSGKSIEILSSSKSGGMERTVFERLIEAEKESSQSQNVEDLRVGPKNYSFQMLGTEKIEGHLCYVLKLTPKRKSKYLIDGKAWISADDYGLVRVQGRPSQRVSFWVGKPEITQTYRKVGPAWMLISNQSSADVRLIGRSELAIESSGFDIRYLDHDHVLRAARTPREHVTAQN